MLAGAKEQESFDVNVTNGHFCRSTNDGFATLRDLNLDGRVVAAGGLEIGVEVGSRDGVDRVAGCCRQPEGDDDASR